MGCACCSNRPAEVLPPEEPHPELSQPGAPVLAAPVVRTSAELKMAPSEGTPTDAINTVDLTACRSKDETIRYLNAIQLKEKAEQVLINMRGTAMPSDVQHAMDSFLESSKKVRGFSIDFSKNKMGRHVGIP